MTEQTSSNQDEKSPQFSLLRIYLKDVSFETPNSPTIFLQEWKPEINLQLTRTVNELENSVYEVILAITVTAKDGDKTGFLVEIQQAGLFSLNGLSEEQVKYMLGTHCPATLFPFAREAISDLVVKGGFPQLLLAPIHFEALYAQNLNKATDSLSTPELGSA
jgi:preprotein translocase subunit SecB